jgi:flavin reductase (DIM6/NTAB) family NADH-FMN oxidoreductase RutF
MMRISQEHFRQVLGTFCTGVTIVTFRSNGIAHGLTVNAFSSLSLVPALILICIKKEGTSHTLLLESDNFAVNILCEKQADLAQRFANSELKSDERFKNTELQPKISQPVFLDNLSYLICKTVQRYDGGDHSIFIGEVQDVGINPDKKPLIYYSSAFGKL